MRKIMVKKYWLSKSKLAPICPFCGEEQNEFDRFFLRDFKFEIDSSTGLSPRRCYACPNCRKVLGFSDYDGDDVTADTKFIRAQYFPICPHCQLDIQGVSYIGVHGEKRSEFCYVCPECFKVLGFSNFI